LKFKLEIAIVKYLGSHIKICLPLPIKPQILILKKIPQKFNIIVRVEMARLKQKKITLLK